MKKLRIANWVMNDRFSTLRWVCFAVSIAMAAAIFWPAARFSVSMFRDPQEDLSHGWLIPLVSAYAVWRNRAALRAAAGRPAWGGWFAIMGCLAFFWLGSRGEQARLMQIGMIGLVVAVPYALWGAGVARKLLFPCVYLLFILPASFLDVFTFPLRLLAAWVATGLLNGVGLGVQQIGTALLSTAGDGFKLDVADPCSGMRSIFALAALTAAYAYLTHKVAWRRLLLFASAVPLAIAGNIARIIAIVCVAHWMGQEKAVGFYHDYSGYVVFVVAVLLMLQVDVWVTRLGRKPGVEASGNNQAPPANGMGCAPAGAGRLRMAQCVWIPVTFMVAGLLLRRMPIPAMEADDFIATEQPKRVGALSGSTPLYCHNDQCLQVTNAETLAPDAPRICPRCDGALAGISLGEKTWLPADTRLVKRTYRGVGEMLTVSVVVSGSSRRSIHRPEMCLPGQGFHIRSSRTQVLDLGNGRHLRVRIVRAARAGEQPIGFIYWFVNPRMETASHWVRIFTDIWSRSVRGRVNRWSMITLFGHQPFDEPERLAAVERFLSEWYPRMLLEEGMSRAGVE